jgi:hypothetical protein
MSSPTFTTVIKPSQKPTMLKRLSHSYNKNWKPILAAKADLDDEYTFASGPRRGVAASTTAHETSKEQFGYRMD